MENAGDDHALIRGGEEDRLCFGQIKATAIATRDRFAPVEPPRLDGTLALRALAFEKAGVPDTRAHEPNPPLAPEVRLPISGQACGTEPRAARGEALPSIVLIVRPPFRSKEQLLE